MEGEFERARQASVRYAHRERLKARDRRLRERRQALVRSVNSSDYTNKSLASPSVLTKRSGLKLLKSIGLQSDNGEVFQYLESIQDRDNFNHPDLGTLERFEKV